MNNVTLTRLNSAGVSVWLDDLSRQRLEDGSLEQLVRDQSIVGITTNPTIFAQALRSESASAYQAHLNVMARRGTSPETAVRELITYDARRAADVLAATYRRTDGWDGFVSLEVNPELAHDTEATVAEARELWKIVGRPNLMIKIPATPAGLEAISACLAEGINVNATLIFSVERYAQVFDAYLDGLERAQLAGHDLATVSSVASFFISRLDAAVDPRFDEAGTDEARAVRGRVAVANARLAYRTWQEKGAGYRYRSLVRMGARPQRLLWASTGVKDPAYSDTRYVDELLAPCTVNTMPEATLRAVADHGNPDSVDRITGNYADARRVIEALPCFGISYSELVTALEAEALAKFTASWRELLDSAAAALPASESLQEAA